MKNFDQFSRNLRINESEVKFVNENEKTASDLLGDVVAHLEDNDITAFDTDEKPDGSVEIHIEGDVYNIKKEGTTIHQTWKHGKETFKTEEEFFTWWSTFVPQYKQGEAEYNRGE